MTRRHDGFTLVEMLVAISVTALLISLVYGALRVGQKSAAAMDAQAEHSESMRIAWLFLYDTLTHARAVQNPMDADDESGFFGTATEMRFVTDMPAHVSIGGLVWLSLSTDRAAKERPLVLTLRRFTNDEDPQTEEPLGRAVFVEDLESMEIAYFGQAQIDEPATWHDEWQDIDTLPNLVKIRIKPTDSAAWPLIIARPLTGSTPLDDGTSPDRTSRNEGQQATDEDNQIEEALSTTEDPAREDPP